jgi:hypothetical protein
VVVAVVEKKKKIKFKNLLKIVDILSRRRNEEKKIGLLGRVTGYDVKHM